MSDFALPEGSIAFRPRGVGNNWLPCFICGHLPKIACQHDLAAFIDAKFVHVIMKGDVASDGKPIVVHPMSDLAFKERFLGSVDYRESEPTRVQFKFGACGEHLPNLELLNEITDRTGYINAAILATCLPGRKLP